MNNANILCNDSFIAASTIVKNNKNFVHDELHIISVEKNVINIAKSENISEDGLLYLRLAAHWHDVGRIDSDEEEIIAHEELSVKMFAKWAKKKLIDDKITNIVNDIILQHRNRNKRHEVNNRSSEILWDADKLDIINVDRCRRIIMAYRDKINNDKSEFNFKDTLNFWSSIDSNFFNSFHTNKAKAIFNFQFPEFIKFLQETSNEVRIRKVDK